MSRTIHCPNCQVELTIPDEVGHRKLKCPKCANRFMANGAPAPPPTRATPHSSAKTAKVPPSSGRIATTHPFDDDLPLMPSQGHRTFELPLLGDDDEPSPRRAGSSASARTPAEALFLDDSPGRPTRRSGAEARAQSRKCPSCGTIVPVGMSLCRRCNLDLDTGLRVEEDEPEAVVPVAEPGPPVTLLVIGVSAMLASGVLSLVSFFGLGDLGGIMLGIVSLFGVLASIQFMVGRTARLLTTALLLGAFVDVIALIILPTALPDLGNDSVAVKGIESGHAAPRPESVEGAETPTDDATPGVGKLHVDEVNMTKVYWGVAILIIDGVVLIYINSPGVHRHFEHRRRTSGPHGPSPIRV